jgi:hypothetical protein
MVEAALTAVQDTDVVYSWWMLTKGLTWKWRLLNVY